MSSRQNLTDGRPSPGRRAPLHERKRAHRQKARARIALRTQRAVTAEQHAIDPLARRATLQKRLVWLLVMFLGSLGIHGLVIALGLLWGSLERQAAEHEDVTVSMREQEKPKPEEKKPPPKPKEVAVEAPAAPPMPDVPPPPKAKAPPPRVVGLSLDSTSGGGAGPSFAVGNTREGRTAEIAEDPNAVSKTPGANQVASRIPVAGAKYVLPKRKNPSTPPYPETLKAQGIEADVTVMVTIDATGKVTSVKLIKESPYPEFNEAARAAAAAEAFEPATKDGVAVPYTLSFTYRFRLEDA